jgi:hypothetical protein
MARGQHSSANTHDVAPGDGPARPDAGTDVGQASTGRCARAAGREVDALRRRGHAGPRLARGAVEVETGVDRIASRRARSALRPRGALGCNPAAARMHADLRGRAGARPAHRRGPIGERHVVRRIVAVRSVAHIAGLIAGPDVAARVVAGTVRCVAARWGVNSLGVAARGDLGRHIERSIRTSGVFVAARAAGHQ